MKLQLGQQPRASTGEAAAMTAAWTLMDGPAWMRCCPEYNRLWSLRGVNEVAALDRFSGATRLASWDGRTIKQEESNMQESSDAVKRVVLFSFCAHIGIAGSNR